MASTIPDLLHELRSGHSSSPRLTWYGPGGERIELSGRVLDNWVAKTANFLTEELDAERGTRVRVDLPAHWKSAVVALAAWDVGAVLLSGDDNAPAEITFVGPDAEALQGQAHDAAGRAGEQVAVALGALEMAYPGQLPQGTHDYAALVRQFADSFEPFDPPVQDDEALRTDGGSITQAELTTEFAAPTPEGARVVVSGRDGLAASLAGLLGAWNAGGSAVLLHPDVDDTEHLRRAENVTPR